MAGAERLRRGDVWLVALDPVVGSELRKTRPCVIVSPDEIHNNIRTLMIVPLTSGSRPAPARIETQFNGVQGLILLEHIRSVDKQWLVKKLGALDDETLARVLKTLQLLFTL